MSGRVFDVSRDPRWRSTAAFLVRQPYPKGKAPKDVHPEAFGKIVARSYLDRGGWQVEVLSTKRRPDGWSYVVVVDRAEPNWFSYFHNAKTGTRIRHLGLNGQRIAHAFGVPYDGAPF